MRDEIELNVSIPLDEEGYIELECDYCKNRFMLHESVYSDKSNLFFFCPICGLPNDISSFFCPEHIEAMRQKVSNYINNEIQKQIGSVINGINKNGFVQMSLEIPKNKAEKELLPPINENVISFEDCCNVNVKMKEFDILTGQYCPICGGTKI